MSPVARAIQAMRGGDGHVVLMSAQGRLFDQAAARRLAGVGHLVLVCGHYEGVDERVIEHDVDEELSIGDYVLTGGGGGGGGPPSCATIDRLRERTHHSDERPVEHACLRADEGGSPRGPARRHRAR